jgi:hypothetical protein
MAVANSYSSWYQIAKQLDHSKGRDKWQRNVEDETIMRYDWAYIKELIVDLRAARHANDAVFGLAVLSQCSQLTATPESSLSADSCNIPETIPKKIHYTAAQSVLFCSSQPR